ncbi:uncharacterized protein LOC130185583 isoform X3 [Seriola aureovittata]|uniref:uncharacterized protein LOC130185583 isoform X3 n=1 Tax=Seriola aureovittata TaxID=2871759 RepID=UPI0024BF002A|nr:uncharacterized protein LOC130185583 isoform X3 [Seriola aureovittata]
MTAARRQITSIVPLSKPPRTKYMMQDALNSSYDVPQPAYEDPDAAKPAVTDGSQRSEVKVKPVPRPRSKSKPENQSNTNVAADSGDDTNNNSNAVSFPPSERPAERPHPVRPPPRPPKCLTFSKPAAAVDGGSQRMDSNAESTVKPPAENTQNPPPPRPQRPPPSVYCDKLQSAMQSTTRPPPPPFNPPPPPSTGTPSDSVYWEIEHRPYLDILSKDEDKMTQGKTMPRSGLRFQSSCFSSCREDTDDYYGMLRWLTRVSRPDYMTPSLYGLSIEEETRLFNQRAVDVSKALRLFNVLMMKRNETLRNVITEFSSISSSLDKLQKKTKNMGIAGGTTGAVGGVTAVVGIALAPMTMGASLIATVVGAGMVASAGGMGAHTAKANKKIVNRMRVEKLVYDYKTNVADLEHCLNFILSVMNELRRHDIARLQQAGAQTHALKMAHLSQSVFRNDTDKGKRRSSAPHAGGLSSERLLLAFVKELDQYFTEKDGQKLKKTNKSRFSGRVRLLAENLQEELEHLNHMWEKFS